MVAPDEYDFWLFDLDGTLVDVEFGYARSVLAALGDRLGCSFTDREVRVLWYGLNGTREEILAEKDVTPERFWDTFHEVEDPVARAEATYLYDDAAFVADVEAPVGLVTHCQQYLADPVLDHLDIRDWFDAIICCTDDTGWKPDPAPLRHVMGGLGVGPPGGDRRTATDGGPDRRRQSERRGILAGDSPADVGAAANAGLDSIHVERHGHDVRDQCVRADYRVESFDELDL